MFRGSRRWQNDNISLIILNDIIVDIIKGKTPLKTPLGASTAGIFICEVQKGSLLLCRGHEGGHYYYVGTKKITITVCVQYRRLYYYLVRHKEGQFYSDVTVQFYHLEHNVCLGHNMEKSV